jgi:hypothetical protein
MNSKTVIGGLLIMLAASLAGGGVYALHNLKQKKFDPDTLCPVAGPQAVTVIVIDKTDSMTASEQARVRSLLEDERDRTARDGRISINFLKQKEGTKETVIEKVTDLCNPGSEANPLFENPKRVAARYANAFLAPIDGAMAAAGKDDSASASPIAAAIASALEKMPDVPGVPAKLILVSDLMEHSAGASAYYGTLDEAALRKLMPQGVQARLRNTGVRIMLLGRPRFAKQQQTAIAVWRSFFRSASGREPEFIGS